LAQRRLSLAAVAEAADGAGVRAARGVPGVRLPPGPCLPRAAVAIVAAIGVGWAEDVDAAGRVCADRIRLRRALLGLLDRGGDVRGGGLVALRWLLDRHCAASDETGRARHEDGDESEIANDGHDGPPWRYDASASFSCMNTELPRRDYGARPLGASIYAERP